MTWLYVPSICAMEAEDGSSLSDSPASTYEPWLELSGKPSRRPLSWHGWKTRSWIKLLSGTISRPSMADRGAAEWISSLPRSPASRSRRQVASWELTTTATSGPTHIGSLLTFDLESYSWRTAPSLFGSDGSTMSSGILPRSGSMLNGVCWRRRALGPLTIAVGSGCWPTPTWKDSERSGSIGTTTRGITLTDRAVRMWGTPVAQDDNKSPEAHLAMKERMGGGRTQPTSLQVQTKMWQTPTTSEAWAGSSRHRGGDRADELLLKSQAKMWPSPKASENERGSDPARGPKGGSPSLKHDALKWPTPAAHDAKHDAPNQAKRNTPGLPTAASLHSPATETPGSSGSPSTDLNPAFVESLLGLPAGWSDPLASLTGFTSWGTAWSSHVRLLLSGSWRNEHWSDDE